jgi:uncharacterized integral membrane protein
MVVFRVVLMLVAFVIVLMLALPNAQYPVDVRVFLRTYSTGLAEVMLYSFALGALCVGIFTLVSEIQLRSRLHRLRREMEALTEELRLLRNAPLEGELPARPDRQDNDGGES